MTAAKLKSRLILLQTGSFVVSITPLLTMLIINWDRYTKTPADTVKLSLGGILIVLFVFLKAMDKLRMPRRVVLFGVVFLMSYLLKSLMNDMILLSGMALAGEGLDLVFFQKVIKTTKENIAIGKTADATSQQVEEVIKKYIGNGRT